MVRQDFEIAHMAFDMAPQEARNVYYSYVTANTACKARSWNARMGKRCIEALQVDPGTAMPTSVAFDTFLINVFQGQVRDSVRHLLGFVCVQALPPHQRDLLWGCEENWRVVFEQLVASAVLRPNHFNLSALHKLAATKSRTTHIKINLTLVVVLLCVLQCCRCAPPRREKKLDPSTLKDAG